MSSNTSFALSPMIPVFKQEAVVTSCQIESHVDCTPNF